MISHHTYAVWEQVPTNMLAAVYLVHQLQLAEYSDPLPLTIDPLYLTDNLGPDNRVQLRGWHPDWPRPTNLAYAGGGFVPGGYTATLPEDT